MRVQTSPALEVALGHDPEKYVAVFPRDKREAFARRSCSNKRPERDDDSKKSHSALAASCKFERQAATDQGPAVLARQLEGAVEGANPFIHTGQAPAETALRREADAVVRNLDGDVIADDRGADLHGFCLRVPQDVGYAFLDDAIGGLRKQPVDVVEAMVDPRGETDAGGLRLRVSQQGLQALFQ